MATTRPIPDPTTAVTAGGAAPKEPWFARLARFSATRRRLVMIVWLVATLAAAPLALTLTSALSGAGWDAQGSVSAKVRDELRRDFPQLGAEAAVVVYRQRHPIATDPAGLKQLVADLHGAPGTAAVVDPTTQPRVGRPHRRRWANGADPRAAGRVAADAGLPTSAGQLIDHVAGLRLPGGSHGQGHRRVGGVERLQQEQRGGAAPRRAPVGHPDDHPVADRLRLGHRRRHSRCCWPWPASPSGSPPCT